LLKTEIKTEEGRRNSKLWKGREEIKRDVRRKIRVKGKKEWKMGNKYIMWVIRLGKHRKN